MNARLERPRRRLAPWLGLLLLLGLVTGCGAESATDDLFDALRAEAFVDPRVHVATDDIAISSPTHRTMPDEAAANRAAQLGWTVLRLRVDKLTVTVGATHLELSRQELSDRFGPRSPSLDRLTVDDYDRDTAIIFWAVAVGFFAVVALCYAVLIFVLQLITRGRR